MGAFEDSELQQIGERIDDQGQQRLGEVASEALNNDELRGLAFTPDRVQAGLRTDAGLAKRLERGNLGSLSDAELRYCERWAELANQQFPGNDERLIQAINAEAGDRGPAG